MTSEPKEASPAQAPVPTRRVLMIAGEASGDLH